MSRNPPENLPEIASHDLFTNLIEQWEKRAETANNLANDAASAGNWAAEQRCRTKAGVIRSMTQELKREILQANRRAVWLIARLYEDLPTKRDWLNPDYEREMKEISIANASRLASADPETPNP